MYSLVFPWGPFLPSTSQLWSRNTHSTSFHLCLCVNCYFSTFPSQTLLFHRQYSAFIMKIPAIILMILVAVPCSSCPTRHVVEPQLEKSSGNQNVTGSDCIAVVRQDTHFFLPKRIKRSRSGEVSFSPQSTLPPYTMPDNSTQTNTTLPNPPLSLEIASWPPTIDKIVTHIFRTISLVLSLFNINITRRIHGKWQALSSYSFGSTES